MESQLPDKVKGKGEECIVNLNQNKGLYRNCLKEIGISWADGNFAHYLFTMSKHASISDLFRFMLHALNPSFTYSWSTSHILQHELFFWGNWAVRKLFLSIFELLLRVFFSTFHGQILGFLEILYCPLKKIPILYTVQIMNVK